MMKFLDTVRPQIIPRQLISQKMFYGRDLFEGDELIRAAA